MDVCYIVNRSCNILQVLNLVTFLSCILQEILRLRISTYETRELVVSCTVSTLREVDRLLDNGSGILADHCLAVKNLKNYISLTQLKLVQRVNCCSIQCIDECLVVLIHRLSILILLSSHPSLVTSLAILLSNSLEISTTGNSALNRICLSLSLSY